ncbi:hypothetical protein ABS751_07060 [Bacillus subtilis]|uniref:hypothetical protein n=1 Tax=Bacillus subtilis TaxID=1423 RepID=UPI00202B8144|nr:hypothetical protein [Bacillus subtilis]
MAVLTRRDLSKMEEYYYWGGNRTWSLFPEELREKLVGIYGEELFHTHGLNRISMKGQEKS